MNATVGHRPTWAEINLDNLAENYWSVKRFIGNDIEVMAVVKANGYGHGGIECAKRLESEGANWLAVAIPEEAVQLRLAGVTCSILCLGGFWSGQEMLLLRHDLASVVYSIPMARSLNAAAEAEKKISRIHIKIDTGMGRVGFRWDELDNVIKELKTFRSLEIEGIMTHFAAADDLQENEFTGVQIDRFNAVVETFEKSGISAKFLDLANSPGAIVHERSRGNLVRLGGILYGLGGDVLPDGIDKPELKPVMSIHSQIAQLKVVPQGESLGYSRTFITKRESVIATIPIGYNDGYPRNLSNKGNVIINGELARVVGRVSMDWILVDVSDIKNVKVNDEVVIIGSQHEASILAENLSSQLETISYEITCGISHRVPRVFVGN